MKNDERNLKHCQITCLALGSLIDFCSNLCVMLGCAVISFIFVYQPVNVFMFIVTVSILISLF